MSDENGRRLRNVAASGAAVVLAWAVTSAGGQVLPSLPDVLDTTGSKANLGVMDFDAAVPRRIPVAADVGEVSFPFRMADAGSEFTWTLAWEGGRKTRIRFRVGPGTFTQSDKSPGAQPLASVTKSLPDACLEMSSLGVRYFVRPNPHFYNEGEIDRLRDNWMSFPDAASHVFRLAL